MSEKDLAKIVLIYEKNEIELKELGTHNHNIFERKAEEPGLLSLWFRNEDEICLTKLNKIAEMFENRKVTVYINPYLISTMTNLAEKIYPGVLLIEREEENVPSRDLGGFFVRIYAMEE